jgi:uncharacterized damage-inducible protein DinB
MKGYLSSLVNTPKTLVNIVDQVKPDHYNDHTDPERFTLRELIAHLADFDDVFLDRLRLAHESPGASVGSIDPDARASEKNYATRDVHHELDVFENRRRDLVEFLTSLSPEDWQKKFHHPDLGDVTIESYANIILAHDLSHVSHATSYLR